MQNEPGIAIGSPVPDFTLENGRGEKVNLTRYREGGIAALAFLSARCPVSLALHSIIAGYARDYAPKGVRFLGIMSNATEVTSEVAAALDPQGITFPILDDPEFRIADALGAMGTPHMYIVDRDGTLRYSGAVCENWKELDKPQRFLFQEALDAVLAGKPVADPQPGAFIGCTIKRNKG